MRHGMSPQDAGMDALKRIVRNYKNDMNKLRFVDMTYYSCAKTARTRSIAVGRLRTRQAHKIAVHDGTRRAENAVAMFKRLLAGLPAGTESSENVKKEYLK